MLQYLGVIVCVIHAIVATPPHLYSNHFIVKVKGGFDEAKNIAQIHKLRLLPTVSYIFIVLFIGVLKEF
jgi:hypothetical protein